MRNYKKEYDNYHATEKAKKERAKRNAARRELEKEGRVSKGDGKDVMHKRALRVGGSNAKSNLKVGSKSVNRADNGHRKGEKQKKWRK